MYNDKKYLDFLEARKFVRSLKLEKTRDWYAYIDGKFPNLPPLPDTIPRYPKSIYQKRGWWGMYDFLGIVKIIKPRD